VNAATVRRVLAAGASALLVAASAAACDHGEYAQVCVDRHTHQRADNSRCDRGENNLSWWYIPYGSTVPPVGRPVDTEGSYRRPAAATVRRTVSSRGGRVGGAGAKPRGGRVGDPPEDEPARPVVPHEAPAR
jgi:hypothetical protein